MGNRFYIVRVNRDDADTYASGYSVAHAVEISCAGPKDTVEWAQVYANDAGAARLKRPKQWRALPDGNV